jgi:methionine aminopeptidase
VGAPAPRRATWSRRPPLPRRRHRGGPPGARVGDIGAAIEALAAREGCSVVRDLGGHGIGRAMHMPPTIVHVGPPGTGLRLRRGWPSPSNR